MFPIKCKFIGYFFNGFPIVMFDYQRVYPNLSNISNDCWFTSPSCWSKVGFPNPTLLSDPARVLIPRSTVNNGWQSTQKDSEHQQKSTKNMDSDTEEKEHSRKFWRLKKSQNSHKIIAMLRIIAGDHVTMALFFGELGILGAFGVLVDGNLENLLGHVSPGTQQKYMEDQHFELVNSG